MQPQQPQDPQQSPLAPPFSPEDEVQPAQAARSMYNEAHRSPRKSRKKLAIFLIVWPIVLIPLLIVLNIVVASTFPDSPPSGGELFGTPSPVKSVVAILTFLGGAINILAGLPSFITGIVLLAKGSKSGSSNE